MARDTDIAFAWELAETAPCSCFRTRRPVTA
jgi:hypothetical protein